MTTFFTSDWHFGDPRVQILGRPFETTEEMTERIIDEYNRRVGPDDVVYCLGDVLSTTTSETLDVVDRLNGTKHLVRGNHDRQFTDEEFSPYFHTIIAEGDGIELDVEGIPCWLTHYPTRGRADRFNLVGHIHSAWRVGPDRGTLNIGIDANWLAPIPSTIVKFMYDSIENFYDEDVWMPGIPPRLERGKPGTYLQRDSAG